MKYILLIIIINSPFIVQSQSYLVEFDKYNSTYDFDWRGLESKDEYDNKLKFVEFVETNNLMTTEIMMLKHQKKKLIHTLKSVDINNDNLSDIIYSGPSAGEGNIVTFFIKNRSGYQSVFTLMQGIVKIEWKNNMMDKIYSHDWGCCADQTLTNHVYQVNYSNTIPKLEKIWESVELEEFTTKPKNYWDSPKRFEITNEIYKLRGQPYIDNETENSNIEITGNTIGILEKGFKGTAYASSVDETGRIWWYVTIDSNYQTQDSYTNYSYKDYKPYLVGWISSRYISEIKNE